MNTPNNDDPAPSRWTENAAPKSLNRPRYPVVRTHDINFRQFSPPDRTECHYCSKRISIAKTGIQVRTPRPMTWSSFIKHILLTLDTTAVFWSFVSAVGTRAHRFMTREWSQFVARARISHSWIFAAPVLFQTNRFVRYRVWKIWRAWTSHGVSFT